MVARAYSMGTYGMDAFPVEVETDLSSGLPSFEVVGLPDTAVKESRDRVRAAMKNCGFDFPLKRIVINLAPADKRKEGPIYDLPLLVSLLKSSEQLDSPTSDAVFLGELSLGGAVRPVRGVLPMAVKAKEAGFHRLFVPAGNAAEAAAVKGLKVYPVENVTQLMEHLTGKELIPQAKHKFQTGERDPLLDFADVKGQVVAKRALEIAASGSHSVIMIGPPGSGKSMLAKRLPSILPDMTFQEALEVTMIHSVAGNLPSGSSLLSSRPFRSPHHTISTAGLSGGGTSPRPGEISLAHNGVLFLDELPEFPRPAMEALRQPMEDGKVTISRVHGNATFPCKFMVVAAMNPCPCGYFGHPTRSCTCQPYAVERYLSRISGPLLDRLDLHVEAAPVEVTQLASKKKGESSASIRKRVNAARQRQVERYAGMGWTCNAEIPSAKLHEFCPITMEAEMMLKTAFDQFGFSARSYDRILRVARTIADLESCDAISTDHLMEALQFRTLDRKFWGSLR